MRGLLLPNLALAKLLSPLTGRRKTNVIAVLLERLVKSTAWPDGTQKRNDAEEVIKLAATDRAPSLLPET